MVLRGKEEPEPLYPPQDTHIPGVLYVEVTGTKLGTFRCSF